MTKDQAKHIYEMVEMNKPVDIHVTLWFGIKKIKNKIQIQKLPKGFVALRIFILVGQHKKLLSTAMT